MDYKVPITTCHGLSEGLTQRNGKYLFHQTLVQCELSNETGRTRYCVIGKDVIAFNTNL